MTSINNVAQSAAAATTTERQPPAHARSIGVGMTGPESLQVTVNHSAPVVRGARYFTEFRRMIRLSWVR